MYFLIITCNLYTFPYCYANFTDEKMKSILKSFKSDNLYELTEYVI